MTVVTRELGKSAKIMDGFNWLLPSVYVVLYSITDSFVTSRTLWQLWAINLDDYVNYVPKRYERKLRESIIRTYYDTLLKAPRYSTVTTCESPDMYSIFKLPIFFIGSRINLCP